MAGLFEGVQTTAPTGSTSTTELPKWFQDLTYQQMMAARNVADQPYAQYGLPRVAGTSPDQQAAYASVRNNVGSWQPYVDTATAGLTDLTNPTAGYKSATDILSNNSGASSVDNIKDYMNPYNDAVTKEIARMGARNLNENILPGVSDSFVRAGQFGSSRMGDIGSRAIRDTQETVLGKQADVLQSGYTGALSAANNDLNRQLTAGQDMGSLAGSEAQRQAGALTSVANLGTSQQGMKTQDAAALEAIGTAQKGQNQMELDAGFQNWLEQQNYPKEQLNWLQAQLKNTGEYVPKTTSTTGTTTTSSPSPLSQLAALYATYKGITG